MEPAIKTPEQLLRYRSLQKILAEKPAGVYAVTPDSSVFSAIQLMADKNIGFVVVEQNGKLVGVLSERDYARKVILKGRSSKDVVVREIMTTDVVTVTLDHTVPQCMALMHGGSFRHLPVVADGKTLGVLSIPLARNYRRGLHSDHRARVPGMAASAGSRKGGGLRHRAHQRAGDHLRGKSG